jgi:HlyD family secretion protein
MNLGIKYLSLALILFIWIGFASGCQVQTSSAEANKQQPKLIPVKTVSVVSEDIEQTTVQPATVHAFHEVEIRPKVTGYVYEVLVDIGDAVEKGDTLATVDVPEMGKQRDVINARILKYQTVEKQADAGIDLAKADVVSAEARLAQTKSQLNQVEASLAAQEAEFARTQDLVNSQSIERRLLDEARKKRDSVLASREATRSAISSSEADINVAKAKLASAVADLTTAKAETKIALGQLAEIDVLIGYATLKAPFKGVITQRSVDPGTLVREADNSGSNKPLFMVSQNSKVRVHVNVPETDAVSVNQGDAITLSFPFFANEKPITGEVTRTSNSLDPSTRTMLVESVFENSDGKLLPGMFGQAAIKTSTKIAAKMLPARAVRFDESGNAYVYALDEAETVSVIAVTTGLDNGNTIEIVAGVETNQRVIDTHLRRFTDGEKVTVLTE